MKNKRRARFTAPLEVISGTELLRRMKVQVQRESVAGHSDECVTNEAIKDQERDDIPSPQEQGERPGRKGAAR